MTKDQTIAAAEVYEERAAICEYDGILIESRQRYGARLSPQNVSLRLTGRIETDRENYAAYVQDRIENGWTTADVKEYRDEVKRIMKTGTDDEKAAASELWAHKREEMIGSALGINERIHADIEAKKKGLG